MAGVREHGDNSRGMFLCCSLCIGDCSLCTLHQRIVYITILRFVSYCMAIYLRSPLHFSAASSAANSRNTVFYCRVTSCPCAVRPLPLREACFGFERRGHHAPALQQQRTSTSSHLRFFREHIRVTLLL